MLGKDMEDNIMYVQHEMKEISIIVFLLVSDLCA